MYNLAYGALFFTDKIIIYRSLAAAHAVLECTHAILLTDAAAEPSNSQWQRDLVVSYYKLATFAKQTNSGDATAYWQKCLVVLRRMRDRQMFIDPPVAQLFQQLENQYGK